MVHRGLGYFIFVFDCDFCCSFYQIRCFHCYKKKYGKQEKKRKTKTTKFGQILSQSIDLRKLCEKKKFREEPCLLTFMLAGGLQHISPLCQITQLNQACFNHISPSCQITQLNQARFNHISSPWQITQLKQARFNCFRFAMLASTVPQFFSCIIP